MCEQSHLEYVCCPICEETQSKKAYDFDPYHVVQCESCGLYYLSPRPKESVVMEMYTDNAYFEGDGNKAGYESYIAQEKALRATFRKFLRNMKKRNITGGKLLDVGCGYGFFLDEARGFFERRAGVELSPQAREEAKKHADVVYSSIEEIPVHETFDCITAIHVIEHIYHPKEFLQHLCSRLNQGGKIVLATPDMGSFWRKLFGKRWPSFKIGEHVLFFDIKSLHELMKRIGLRSIASIPYPHAFPLGLIASKLHLSMPGFPGRIHVWLPGTTIAMYGLVSHE